VRPKSTLPKEFELNKRHSQTKAPVNIESPYEHTELNKPQKNNEATFGKPKWD